MATLKFYLKNPKNATSTIFFRLNYGAFEFVDGKKRYLPFQYQIDETIEPKFWNVKECKARETSKFAQFPEFNSRLNNIRDTAFSILRKMQNDGSSITNDTLRIEFDSVFKQHKNQTESNEMQLMAFIAFYIETSNRAEGTKKGYNLLLANLLEYERLYKTKLTFEQIDLDFHNKFVHLLQSKDYAPNTVGGRIKMLKVFMNEAYQRNLHNNLDFSKKAFSKPSEITKNIYLDESELMKLHKLDLSTSSRYAHVRDWFLIGAYTGLRFSDLQHLSSDNIVGDNIEIKTVKTDTLVVIPLHHIVKEILTKYKQGLPKIISNQKFNDYIKDVVKMAEITEDILIEEIKGSTKTRRTEKKYNLVSAHTARRSFATNAFLAGVPTIQIMKMTGHSTEKSFLLYIKISEKENAQKLQSHPFFNK